MIEWPWVAAGYLSFGVVALYLQHLTNVAALDRLATAHEHHVLDLRQAIEILQLDLLHARETMTQARPNRATHAELEL